MADEYVALGRDRLGVETVAIDKHLTILDVDCGGGRTIGKLATLANAGLVYGVDYASGSVAAARSKHARLIETGRRSKAGFRSRICERSSSR